MQFGSMPQRGTMNAMFILIGMQEEHYAKRKAIYMCLVDQEKAFERVPRKVLKLAMRRKGIPDVLARSVMSLYERAKRRFKLSEEFEVKVKMHQECVLSTFLFQWR